MQLAALKRQGRVEDVDTVNFHEQTHLNSSLKLVLKEQAHLNSLPNVVLQLILDVLLPQPASVDTEPDMWKPIVRLLSAGASRARDAWGESLALGFPALGASEKSLCKAWATSLLSALKGGGQGSWQKMSTMRSIRARTQCSTPMQSNPKLSGASLCAVGKNCLVLFGGRCSISGVTLDETYVVRIPMRSSGLANWEKLSCNPKPPVRCYHSATRGSKDSTMFVFGGASTGALLGDAWWFEVAMVPSGPQGCLTSCGQWRRFHQSDSSVSPPARSSHVCAPWSNTGQAVLHGGLGEGGTKSDTWILKPGDCWEELVTTGPRVSRSHHCGGIVGDNFIIYSGQDEMFLAVNKLCMLQLSTLVWQEVVLAQGPSARIDAAAAAVESVGLVVFGGIGVNFEFESPVPWLIPTQSNTDVPPPLPMASRQSAPCSRVCSSMCMDGLHAYVFGGFDGQQDLGDLWCLNLAPNCFQPEQRGSNSVLHFMPESVKGL